jgi:hypothetical protein
MADWIYDQSGHPPIVVDGDRFLNRSGVTTIGWINGTEIFTVAGQHAGWFEDGVLSDLQNRWAGFTADATGETPSRPAELRTRPMPDLGESPSQPDFGAAPIRPEPGGVSKIPLEYIFDDAQPLAPTVHSGYNYRP